MIRLGLRLTLNGGKEAAARLVVTAAAVAIGVGLLLIALAGLNALNAQNARTAWLNTSAFGHGPGPEPGLPGLPSLPTRSGGTSASVNATTSDSLWWMFSADHFGNRTIDRVDVAAGPNSPIPPGIPHLPGPGQFYASPALSRLLRSTPAAELGDRFGGNQIGTIGPSALPAPNVLIIVVGHTAEQLSKERGADQVTSINAQTGHEGATGWDANKLQVILAVGVLALLFPVLIFIGTATRLSAAHREQRFAAMRLVGATPGQVSVISAVEASVAALGGAAVGFGLFFLLRPLLTNVAFTGAPFSPGDLSLGPVDILLVAVGVPVAAAAAARVAMRRVVISPLGVSRHVTPPAPRAYRLLPLVAGVGELAYFVEAGRPKSTGVQIDAYFSGCFLMMAGLVIAGPWLTMVGSRIIVRRTNRPDVLIAGRRLSDNPRGAFRPISGLIIALFATSVSVGVITTILADQGTSIISAAARDTLVEQFGSYFGPHRSAPGQPTTSPSLPDALLSELRSVPGVQGVTVAYSHPAASQSDNGGPFTVLVSCDQLARTPALGRCAAGAGAGVATITGNFGDSTASQSTLAATAWPASGISPERLQSLPIQAIVVGTGGSRSAIERARTALETAFPDNDNPSTLSEISAPNLRPGAELQQLTNVVILVSLVIAGCTLAVSVSAGVSDRKRPFSLLRLTGVPLGVLRRVVALETALPLLVIAVLSAATGLLAAALFLRSQLGESLRPPGLEYYMIVVAGLVASLGILASTLPVIERITGPEIARNE
jgi:hypothetical protein